MQHRLTILMIEYDTKMTDLQQFEKENWNTTKYQIMEK